MRKLITTILCSVMLLCNAAYGFSQNFDTRTKSDVTAEHLNAKLKNKLTNLGQEFINVQEKYGINAEFLVAIAIIESGNGSSRAARKKNNFFGLMNKKGLLSFNSPQECIDYAARNLTKLDGYYFGRGRYTISQIAHRYAANKKWPSMVIATMKSNKKS